MSKFVMACNMLRLIVYCRSLRMRVQCFLAGLEIWVTDHHFQWRFQVRHPSLFETIWFRLQFGVRRPCHPESRCENLLPIHTSFM